MSKINQEKTVSANSKGIVISYGDVNKHMFTRYPVEHVRKIQLHGTVKYQTIEKEFTPIQEDLYQKLVHGFSAYTREELSIMSKTKKFKISVSYTKAHRILNRWKQEIVNEAVDSFMSRLFPHSPVVKQFINVKGYDDNLESVFTFKELGVSKKDIANKLIEFGLLPQNFFNLV